MYTRVVPKSEGKSPRGKFGVDRTKVLKWVVKKYASN